MRLAVFETVEEEEAVVLGLELELRVPVVQGDTERVRLGLAV